MKAWLARAVAATAARGEDRRNRIARWARWFPPARAVDESLFQGAEEPYPRHWRRFPDPWPPIDSADPVIAASLREALDELPERWRQVITGQEAGTVDGTGAAHHRAIRHQALACLRDRLARSLRRGGIR